MAIINTGDLRAGGAGAGRGAAWGFLRNQGSLTVLDFFIVYGLGTQSYSVPVKPQNTAVQCTLGRAGEVVLEEGRPERHCPLPPFTTSDQNPAVPQTGGLLYALALVAPGLQGLRSVSVPIYLWQLHLPSPSGFSLDNLSFLSDYS